MRRGRLTLAGHLNRHNDEPAGKHLILTPDATRRVGHPCVTWREVIEDDTGLTGEKSMPEMGDRGLWRWESVHVSPMPTGTERFNQ